MSLAELNLAIDHHMERRLASSGFEKVRPRMWWRSQREPIQEIVEFQSRKGAAYAGVWGWALSICPLLRGRSMNWKRTRASVELDLWFDPANDDNRAGFLIDAPIPGYSRLSGWQVSRVVERVCRWAMRDFRNVNGLADLETTFDKRSRYKYRGLSTDTSIQFKLAWSLAKRGLGDEVGADLLLSEWTTRMRQTEAHIDESMIAKANDAARGLTGNSNVQA